MIAILFGLGSTLAVVGTAGVLTARARARRRRREIIDAFADREIDRARRHKKFHAA